VRVVPGPGRHCHFWQQMTARLLRKLAQIPQEWQPMTV
jgi:hypothetical protein